MKRDKKKYIDGINKLDHWTGKSRKQVGTTSMYSTTRAGRMAIAPPRGRWYSPCARTIIDNLSLCVAPLVINLCSASVREL